MEKGKEQDFVRELSEAIDKMLAGKRVEPCPGMPVDYQEAIDFAQRLITLKVTPRPSFEAQLKNSLLSKLTEMEGEIEAVPEVEGSSFWVGLRRLVPRQPVWRAVATTLIVVIVAGSVIWGTGIFSKPPVPAPAPAPAPLPAPRPVTYTYIEVEATTSKTNYSPGENIVIEFSFKNISPEPFEIDHFPPAIKITRQRRDQQDEAIRLFHAGRESCTLAPGEVATYTLTWSQHDDQGQQVPYGCYQVRVPDIGAPREVFYGVHKAFILPPEGIIEKTIKVNDSLTVNGITLTLERLELSKYGPAFYILYAPPKYSFPLTDLVPRPPMAYAEYSIDGRTIKEAVSATVIASRENGWEYVWLMSDPVSNGASEVTFTITELGDWEGPWEFHISLQ